MHARRGRDPQRTREVLVTVVTGVTAYDFGLEASTHARQFSEERRVKRSIEQSGFTLIELVVVVTILGILAAFAVPRFAQLEGQARLAATQALAGSIRSGASLSHALWLAQSDPASTSVTMEGTPITIVNGYPASASIDDTLVEFTGFAFTTPGATAVFTKQSSTGAAIANCFVTYTPAPVNGAPNVVATTGGC